MPKIRLGDMSTQDKKEYQYYKRVLQDLYVWGPRYLQERAEDRLREITNKYARSKSNAKN